MNPAANRNIIARIHSLAAGRHSRCFWAWSTPTPPPPPPPRMRTQQPSLRDHVPGGACFPGRGLCCPDDPLELVLQLFPAADRAPPPPSSLAALGIGGGGDPPARRVVKPEPESPPQPLEDSAYGGVGGLQDSWGGLPSFLLEGLWTGLEETDVDMFFADDDALDNGGSGGGEATQGNLLSDPTHMAAAVVVPNPNDASPLPAPMPAGGDAFFPVQAYDACRASFDAAVFNNASAAPPPEARMPAGYPPPVFVTNNGSPPPLPALIMPAAAPASMPAGGAPSFFVTNNCTPPLPALIMPAAATPAPAPMPAGSAPPFFVTNSSTPPLPALIMPAAATPAPMPPTAASLHACDALPRIVSNIAHAPPPPVMAPMPARALHQNAAALAGVYSYTNVPAAHVPPSATPPSRTSFGSGRRSPSSATSSSETEFLQPQHHVWVVPRKLRSPPSANRRKRPWLLDFPLHALPPVALPPQANHTGDDDDDDKLNDDDAKNRNAMALVALTPPGDNTGGAGIRRRRQGPHQRNRQAQRVCSHCHSLETPQWRAGPDGPGTLCNACGIRHAANRLLPEYRPSTAPSFRSGQHSNRHRNVLKLREQMTKPATTTTDEEKQPSSSLEQQPMMEDDRRRTKEEDDDDDDGFSGVCEYISAAGL